MKVSTLFHGDPPPKYDFQPYNVIIFGESGVGKSSVVNLIAGRKVAETSPDAGSCTFASNRYNVVLEGRPYCIWDTIGLNEPDLSCEDYLRSIKHAYKLINNLERSGGIHLLLLCMRGRITESVQQNYKLFINVLCEKKVPLGIVVTHLENEQCMEGWWKENEEVFRRYNISADGHACITAISGVLDDVFKERKMASGEKMHRLLLDLTKPTSSGWKKENACAWFTGLLGKMMRMLPRRFGQPTNKELIQKLGECGFKKKEAAVIADSIMEIRARSTPGDSDGESSQS